MMSLPFIPQHITNTRLKCSTLWGFPITQWNYSIRKYKIKKLKFFKILPQLAFPSFPGYLFGHILSSALRWATDDIFPSLPSSIPCLLPSVSQIPGFKLQAVAQLEEAKNNFTSQSCVHSRNTILSHLCAKQLTLHCHKLLFLNKYCLPFYNQVDYQCFAKAETSKANSIC